MVSLLCTAVLRAACPQKERGNHFVFKNNIEIQKQSICLLFNEHCRNVGGHRLSDERRHHDADLRRRSVPDMGIRQHVRLRSVRSDRSAHPEGARGVLLEADDVDQRHYVRLSILAVDERHADGFRGHRAR